MPVVLWTTAVLCASELIGRSIARRSLATLITGHGISRLGVATVAAMATAALLAVIWKRSDSSRRALALLPLGITLGLCAQISLGARLQSDGFYYFAHLRSLWFDHDQNLANDYHLLGLGDKPHLFTPTATGHAQSAWTIGPAIVWSPFFGAGHLVARGLVRSGQPVAVDGTSFPYQQTVCLGSLFYGLLGLWWSYRLAADMVSRGFAALAVFAVATGSFVLWYLVKEPTMTHSTSLAGAAGFTLFWFLTRDRRTWRQWLLLGVTAGFIATIRWQSVLFAILPLCDWLVEARRAIGQPREDLRRLFGRGLIFLAGATVGFLPQMLVWHAIYGSWLAISPIGPQMRVWEPHLLDILFSSRNGLFATSPVLYVAALGLVVACWRRPRFGVPAILLCLAMWYLNASVQDWWGSASFGMRRFDGIIPLFVVGTATALASGVAAIRRWPHIPVVLVACAFALWNITYMRAALSGAFPLGESVSFEKLAGDQAATLERWVGHPFSYPANLLFAWENDLFPTDYDLLGADRFIGDPARPYGRIDIGTPEDEGRLLLEGWHSAEGTSPVTFRWTQQDAWLLLPLAHAAPLRLQIEAQAFHYEGGPLQQLTVIVAGRSFGPVTVPPDWRSVDIDTPANVWKSGINRVQLHFDWAKRLSDVGLGDDTRLMSAQVNVFRFRVIEAR